MSSYTSHGVRKYAPDLFSPPRPETESYTLYIAELLGSRSFQDRRGTRESPLRILDLCAGTGCISLLLHALLAPHFQNLFVLGIDISTTAVNLAKRNLEHNIRLGLLPNRSSSEIHFHQGDVLDHYSGNIPGVEGILETYLSPGLEPSNTLEWDLLVSNPPYISPTSFEDGTTARSVRTFEPKLALVPPCSMDSMTGTCKQEDAFYYHLIALSFKLSTKLTVLECGSRQQGDRVAALCKDFMGRQQQDHLRSMSIDIWPDVENGHYCNNGDEPCAVIMRRK